MNTLLMPCWNAVTECPVPTTPLLGYNAEVPDLLGPPQTPIVYIPPPSYLDQFSTDWYVNLSFDSPPIV